MVAKSEAKSGKTETGEKKERAPRQDYGYKAGAKITLTKEAGEKKYRGKRLEYFERLQKANGKTVEDFEKSCPAGDPPRGWLRFFVQDGAATLSGGKDPEPKAKKEKAAA
jgi:hypothetical protein